MFGSAEEHAPSVYHLVLEAFHFALCLLTLREDSHGGVGGQVAPSRVGAGDVRQC